MNLFRYGPNKAFVGLAMRLSWPIIIAGKKLSAYPVLKRLINPFFAYPYNEVTAIPIQVSVEPPDSMALPRRILERVVRQASDIFIINQCICRHKMHCDHYTQEIGCMALGKAVRRIHPSHGRLVTLDEALEHVKKASEAGLIASVAHTWIDPVAFGLPDFDHLMFVCFCDDCCCIYRTHMKRRGPNLEKACKRLPGVSIAVHGDLCTGCAVCAEQCFVGAMDMRDGKAYVGGACKGCARCIEVCPAGALSLCLEDEEILVERLMKRIQAVADIS